MRFKSGLAVLLLLGMALLPLVPEVQAVYPVDASCSNTNTNSNTALSCTLASVPAGDVVVLAAQSFGAGGGITGSDTGGLAWTRQAIHCTAVTVVCASLHTATNNGGTITNDVVTATWGASVNNGAVQAYAVREVTVSGIHTGADNAGAPRCAGVTSCTNQLSAALGLLDLTFVSDGFAVNGGQSTNSFTAPPVGSWTFSTTCTGATSVSQYCSGYSFTTTGTSDTLQEGMGSASSDTFYMPMVAISLATTTSAGTQVVTIPCNGFQLQCWWYPTFFFGIYISFIIAIARTSEVPEKDYTGHLLEALTIGSLVAVIIGIISIMFPLIFTIVQVVRALRA